MKNLNYSKFLVYLLTAMTCSFAYAQDACEPYVYLKEGKLYKGKDPYFFKSVNYRIAIIGKQVNSMINAPNKYVGEDNKTYEVMLSSNFAQNNNPWCRIPLGWKKGREIRDRSNRLRCCDNKKKCLERINWELQQMRSVGINSVRLLDNMEYDEKDGTPFFRLGVINEDGKRFKAPKEVIVKLDNDKNMQLYLHMKKQQIQLLKKYNIRSLMIVSGERTMSVFSKQNEWFKNYLKEIATQLKNEPYLVAIDFFNEPSYTQEHVKMDKMQVKNLMQGWYDAVRIEGDNPNILMTIGGSPPAYQGSWDPAIMPIDFMSYHFYARKDNLADRRKLIKEQLFQMAIDSCGDLCPFGGKYDGNNCLIAERKRFPRMKIKGNEYFVGRKKLGRYNGRAEDLFIERKNGKQFLYAKKTQCSARVKPYIIGETGFSNHELDYDTGKISIKSEGNFQEQSQFLAEMFKASTECNSQGLQWWQFHDVDWSLGVREDNYGMWGYYENIFPLEKLPEYNLSTMKPVGTTFGMLDFRNYKINCPNPHQYQVDKKAKFVYQGKVRNKKRRAVPFAQIFLQNCAGKQYRTHTNYKGEYIFNSDVECKRVSAGANGYFGTNKALKQKGKKTNLVIERIPDSLLPKIVPPQTRKSSCQGVRDVKESDWRFFEKE